MEWRAKRKRLIKKEQLRVNWLSVLWGSEWQAEPGIRHLDGGYEDKWGTYHECRVLEWRDDQGLLRGIVSLTDNRGLLMFTDPKWRNRGIATALMEEGFRRWKTLPALIDQQSYTRDGARFMKSFLMRGVSRQRNKGGRESRDSSRQKTKVIS